MKLMRNGKHAEDSHNSLRAVSLGIGMLSNHLAKADNTGGIEAMVSRMSFRPRYYFPKCLSNFCIASSKNYDGEFASKSFFSLSLHNSFLLINSEHSFSADQVTLSFDRCWWIIKARADMHRDEHLLTFDAESIVLSQSKFSFQKIAQHPFRK